MRLEDELARLQGKGLRIMVTSRVPYERNAGLEYGDCNNESCDGIDLQLWELWTCRTCYLLPEQPPDISALETFCASCRKCGKWKVQQCAGHSDMVPVHRAFSHIMVSMDSPSPGYMERLVHWLLQSEHGNLVPLQSKTSKDPWPPSTALGTAISLSDGTRSHLVRSVSRLSDNNVVMARLRAEEMIEATNPEDPNALHDRLPRPTIAIFDAAIRSVAAQTDTTRQVGLRAILLSTSAGPNDGQSAKDLVSRLRSMVPPFAKLHHPDPDSIRRVLHAARGWISIGRSYDGEDIINSRFDFDLYVRENYSEILAEERLAAGLGDSSDLCLGFA
jgi:hypothetical protein